MKDNETVKGIQGGSLISIKGLKKHYNGGRVKALDGVDMEIKKGEVVVIIGPSGSRGQNNF